ncbi:hypothetical protein Bcop_1745 [Bacteroides coprosuis DSM 18011]|uniref:Lipoprotein n=1 Tax=Bacteroides coprosuis DSM 18011 TaxID=679937 RepID=F3ZRC8_9BACE|nr:DUF5074 domain-containing protein [Bacteroides coprosuis]EGJ71936.1 hypothetical protein Bcop_1745 [Bacteroides coprosuis DSM 18011]
MRNYTLFILALASVFLLPSCRKDEYIFKSNKEQVAYPRPDSKTLGFYILNEGNMGMNRASIDYFDYRTGYYSTDIYSELNPNAIKELGDVGNDLKIYGNKLYAVINASNKIEVMNKWTAQRQKVITVPNCRYLAFHQDKAYVSSYSGPIGVDPNAEKGFVAEIDTTSLELTRKVQVGYQPEEMVIVNNKLYVANSGGYRVPNYDTTVSVIDLDSFEEIRKIDVAINLHRMVLAPNGLIYVSSRGDYKGVRSDIFIIDPQKDEVVQSLGVGASELCLSGELLYYYNSEEDQNTGSRDIKYGIIDTNTQQVISNEIITDGTDKQIMLPYGLTINPETKEIYITDAQNYIVTGFVYCFTPDGKLKWKTTAGNIPAHFAFLK